eukprot:5019687-Prymnesium_polylepis.1
MTTCLVSKKLVRAPGASWGVKLSPANKITSVKAGSAAAHAGLLSGDTVVGLSASLERGNWVSVASLNGGSSTDAAAQAIRCWTNALGQPTDTLCIHVARLAQGCSAEQASKRKLAEVECADDEVVTQWVQCCRCSKWRKGVDGVGDDEDWYCELNSDPSLASCAVPEEKATVVEEHDAWYQVERILGERRRGSKRQYR